MIDVNNFDKSSLYQKIDFGNEIVKVNICRIIEHPIHFHKHLEIVLVLEGEIFVKSSSNIFLLKKGEFILLNAFEIHAIKKLSDEAIIAYMHFDLQMKSAEEPLFIYNTEILKKNSKMYSDIIDWLVELIDRFNSILNYMYVHYDEQLSLEYMAKEFNISKFYFSHILKKCFNIPFRDMLNLVRVDRAELPILEDNKTLTQICSDMGFSSYQYFVKQFREYFKMTPMEYRKKYRRKTIKYRGFNEIPYNIDAEKFKFWFGKNRTAESEPGYISLQINLEEDEYQIMTIMEFESENKDPQYDHYNLKKGKLTVSSDSDEMIIKIKRKNKP